MSKILFGIVVPGLVFVFSFLVTYLLYRHFSISHEEHEGN
jgi:hypothetical protein